MTGDADREIGPDQPATSVRERNYALVLLAMGIGLTLLAMVAYPIGPAIAFGWPGLDAGLTILAGVGYWTLFGLVGALRSRPVAGGTVLTFHMPFVVAATILGGPVVGAWMGWLSQFERREFHGVPWYGLLGNHATIAISAVSAGLAGDAVRLTAETAGMYGGASQFLAALTVGLAFAAVNVVLVLPLVSMRRGVSLQEATTYYDEAFRATVLAEAILAWLMALVYLTAGWWAPIACVALVLTIWQAHDRELEAQYDRDTGILNERGFMPHLASAIRASRAMGRLQALLFIDVDDFGRLNKELGNDVGDEVIKGVAGRLAGSVRGRDKVARLHRAGDEFAILLVDLPNREKAVDLASRIALRVANPMAVRNESMTVSRSISIGVAMLDGSIGTSDEALLIADRRMQYAKRNKLGLCATDPEAEDSEAA